MIMEVYMKLPAKLIKRIIGLVLTLVLGFFSLTTFLTGPVYAGTYTSASVTISDSRASATSVTYDFATTLTASTAIDHIDINFCQEASGDTCTAPPGMNTGTPTIGSNNISGSDISVAKISGHNYSIRVTVGTPATQNPTTLAMTFTGITNPNAKASYYVRMTTYSDSTHEIDSGRMGIAILESTAISVTANVAPSFAFTVSAVAASQTVNGATTTVATTDGASIPFGYVTANTPAIAAHELNVVTNATNGYQVTIRYNGSHPLSDGSSIIDPSTGSNDTPATWSAPTGTKNDHSGAFGYTTEDRTLSTVPGAANRFTGVGPGWSNKWAGLNSTAEEVMYSAAGSEAGDTVLIGYQLEVDGVQPPGQYTGTVVLVATPTY
jgi:hypothetical protein